MSFIRVHSRVVGRSCECVKSASVVKFVSNTYFRAPVVKFISFSISNIFCSADADVSTFQEVGVVVLRGLLSASEIDILRDAIDLNLRNPGPLAGRT